MLSVAFLDANTQLPTYAVDDDPIESFSASQSRNEGADVAMEDADEAGAVLECECGVNVRFLYFRRVCLNQDWVFCRRRIATTYSVKAAVADGSMPGWCLHATPLSNLTDGLRCMGYHSGTSDTVPDKFICFDCRVHADQNWDLIMVHNLYPRMMAKFRDLALFRCVARSDRLAMISEIPMHRRAIKICETQNPDSLSAFTKSVGKSCRSANTTRYPRHSFVSPSSGCEGIVAGQLLKQLETEGRLSPVGSACFLQSRLTPCRIYCS